MLLDLKTNQIINKIPHKRQYDLWTSRLSENELEDIENEILELIGEKSIATASWLPGSNWVRTPFYPIYEKACRLDIVASGLCFGLFVWATLMQHRDFWSFGKYFSNNVPIRSLTYFKVQP